MPRRKGPLSPAQIETVRRWIDGGAAWPEGVVIKAPSPPPALAAQSANPARTVRASPSTRTCGPILADNCYACHGPDRNHRQRDLRLDLEEVATAPLPSAAVAIVPRHPETSALLQRVTDPDEQKRMPHVSSGKPRLSAAQIDTLRRWIAEGARWEPHWSYIRPVRPSPPAVKDAGWVRNPVDASCSPRSRRRDSAHRRKRSARAAAARELRPHRPAPTPEDVRAFLADTARTLRAAGRPAAGLAPLRRAHGRALARPRALRGQRRLPQRQLAHGLALSRLRDRRLQPEPPFDQFTAVQLAGDLLPEPPRAARSPPATNRLLQTTEEGGASPGSTGPSTSPTACGTRPRSGWARPSAARSATTTSSIPTWPATSTASRAFFADVKEKPVGRRDPDYLPRARAAPPGRRRRRSRACARRWTRRRRSAGRAGAWEKTLAGRPRRAGRRSSRRGHIRERHAALIQGNDFSIIATTSAGRGRRATPTPSVQDRAPRASRLPPRGVTFDELPRGGPAAIRTAGSSSPRWRSRTPPAEASRSARQRLDAAVAPLHAGRGASTAARPDGGWALLAPTARTIASWWRRRSRRRRRETSLTLELDQNAGRAARSAGSALRDHGRRGRARRSRARGQRTIARSRPGTAEAQRTKQRRSRGSTGARRPSWSRPRRAAARELRKAELVRAMPQSLITTDAGAGPVRILPRGNWLDESARSWSRRPALPAPDRTEDAATRLDLARWLTSPENPLTARVFVNRQWKLLRPGLARTLEDLGSQGEWPTTRSCSTGWPWIRRERLGREALVRTLVTSATYRQSSRARAPRRSAIPTTGSTRRQPASGSTPRWCATTRSPSAASSRRRWAARRPPLPARGYWAYLNFPPREWDDARARTSTGARSTPGGSARSRSRAWPPSTRPRARSAWRAHARQRPQQALALLNDPTYVEAARVLRGAHPARGRADLRGRLRWAYERALGRARARRRSASWPRSCRHTARSTRRPRPRGARAPGRPGRDGLDVVELAAWTSVARAILNLPEMITRS
jgi:hypothetical protein